MDARVPNIIQSRLVQFTKPFDLEKVLYYDSESGRIKLTQAQYVFSYYQHFESLFVPKRPNSSSGSKRGTKKSKLE